MTCSLPRRLIGCLSPFALVATYGMATAAPDLGKRACAREARQLCPAEMRSFSRARVEQCMIARIELTSPTCHSAMLRIKADREAAARAHPSGGKASSDSPAP